MQAPTHFLTGIVISKLIMHGPPNIPLWIQIILIGTLAFLSHIIVDCFAKLTYHTPDPHPEDKFWVGYHIGIAVLTLIIVIIFIREYWWVMIMTVLVDIVDWGVLRAILKKPAWFHPKIDVLREKFLQKLPDYNHTKWSVVIEFLILAILTISIVLL
jgi:hypothetical protein